MIVFLQVCVPCLFPILLVIAALKDATSFTIPNWISLSALIVFVPAALLAGLTPATIELALAVGCGVLICGIATFALGWIGGGDAKLMAVCGLWLGWSSLLPFILVTCITGGALAILLLGLRKVGGGLPQALPGWVRRLATSGEGVPYGLAIAIGALAVFPMSPVAATIGRALR